MISIDTVKPPPTTPAFEDFNIDYSRSGRGAERKARQIIGEIESCESPEEVNETMARHSVVIDAIWMSWPDFAAPIDEAAKDQRIYTSSAQAVPIPAEPGNPAQESNETRKGAKMFNIDTAGGAQGPWLAWQVLPSQDGKIPAQSFYIRDGGAKTPFAGLDGAGVVMDVHAIKVGWQRSDGVVGKAPEWRWWPAPSQRIEKPGDEWKWGISMPCAIGGGKTATWEQAGAAVQNAIERLVPLLNAGPGDGSLPLVKLERTERLQFGAGSTVIPILSVVKWVPRPDCLKEGVQVDTTTSAPAPQADPAPAPQPAAAPADAEF